jgi:Lecithin:cholesterol acyltransferase
MQRPCIIIPGIQGTSLENFYPFAPATTWSTLSVVEGKFVAPDFDSLALDDTGAADRSEDVVTRPAQLFAVAYAPLGGALRGRLGVPAYLFPYDWRFSITQTGRALVEAVGQLMRKPMPTIPQWDNRFDFACHSMGGLVFRAFLKAWKDSSAAAPPVGRVAFIATPHLGSLEAAVALISGETVLFGGRKELRKLARTFPSVYELLPRFSNAVIQAGAELDIFKETNWQTNTTSDDPDPNGYDVQQVHLDAANAVLANLPMPTDPAFGIAAENLLVVYGAKPDSTLRTVNVGPDPDKWYDFDSPVRDTGDDVVLVESARLTGVASVELQADDVSYFHPIERGMVSADMHAFLPALDEVATIVSRFFQGQRGTDLLPLGLPPDRFRAGA